MDIMCKLEMVKEGISEAENSTDAIIHNCDYAITDMDCRIKNPELLNYIGVITPDDMLRMLRMTHRIIEPMLRNVGGD